MRAWRCMAAITDGLAFVNAQYERVWAALEQARLDRQLKFLLRSIYREQGADLADFEANWLELNDLLAGVEWSTLLKQEWAFAGKVGAPPEYILLMRPPTDKLAGNFKGLSAMARKLGELDPAIEIIERDEGGAAMVQIVAPGVVPLALTVARQDDTLLVGLGTTMVEQSLALLAGDAEGTLVETKRFQQALAELPEPSDTLIHLDFDRLFSQIRQTLASALAMGESTGMTEEMQQMKFVTDLIDSVDMFEHLTAVTTTDGLKRTTHSRLVLRENAAEKPFYRALLGNPPLTDPLALVPKEASNMSVTSGVNFQAAWHALLKFIEEKAPDGPTAVANINAGLANLPFKLDEDLLAWVDGGLVTYSVPGPTPFSPGEWALIAKVRDEAKATAMLDQWLVDLEGVLSTQNGRITPVEVAGAEGFKAIDMPMLATLVAMRPTVGVVDGQVFLGSGPKVVEMSLDAKKSGATFAKNERFVKEGLPPVKGVVSMSFQDTTQTGESLAQMLQMAPMIGMFMGPEIQKNPVLSALLRTAGRLGPVARELNFYLSSSSRTTFAGNVLTTEMVDNYREPPKPKTAMESESTSAPATEDESDGE